MSIVLDGTNGIDSPDLTISGTGARITGDFSNATVANRVYFQNSNANVASVVGVLPNGSATTSRWQAVNNSDPTNAGIAEMSIFSTEARFTSGITGTGTYLPMTFQTGGSERMRIDTSGNVGIGGAPSYPLHIQRPNSDVTATITSTNSNLYSAFTTYIRDSTIVWNVGFDGADSNKFKIASGGAVNNFSSGTKLAIDTSGNFQFNSGYGSVATAYGCRAWVNFNGTGTVAIRGSGNVSSITDNGVGDYTVNFTTSLADVNYSAVGACARSLGSSQPEAILNPYTFTTSSCRIVLQNGGAIDIDCAVVCLSFFR